MPTLTKKDLEAALPDVTGTMRLKGLEGVVEVYRDRYGVPHVRAGSTHDAFFGQGFVTAQDRLWHMDHDRRLAYGRWAEYAGQLALEQDIVARRFRILASVKADYNAVNSETRSMLDAFAVGVNAFVESTKALPVEYRLVDSTPELWQPWDCLAAFKARHIQMGVVSSKLWRARMVARLGPARAAEIHPGYPQGHMLIAPPGATYRGPAPDALAYLESSADVVRLLDQSDSGSNNWALDGSRTASGKPLLAGDPHRPLEVPNVYYQNHVACPEFDAIGLSFPGFPGFPHFGHNAHVAWCVTHAQADYQDAYIERFRPGSTTEYEYEYEGEWKQAEVHDEVIEVRGGSPFRIRVTVTRHGPIIQGEPEDGYAIAFKYTATDGPDRGFECIPRMLKATSADDVEEAMRHWIDPCNNFVFGDVHGDMGYVMRGIVPIRSRANAWLPVPGWTGEHEWEGTPPFDEMPRIRDPEGGQIVTANNQIVDEDFPHYIGLQFSPEYRARRISERLSGLDRATVEDMASVHSERVSVPAQVFVRLLSDVEPLDELSARAKERLVAWRGSMDRDEVAPTIYSALRMFLNEALVRHALGPLADDAFAATGRGAPFHLLRLEATYVTRAEEGDTSMLPPGTDWASLMAKALADGVAYLKKRLGDEMDAWTWGSVHATRPRHTLSDSLPELASLLDPPSVPLGGDGDTPMAGSYLPADPFVITGTSIARYVFDTSDWDNSRWITPLGTSGHPGSSHYADQARLWGNLQLVPMRYGWDRIAADAGSKQELKGAG